MHKLPAIEIWAIEKAIGMERWLESVGLQVRIQPAVNSTPPNVG